MIIANGTIHFKRLTAGGIDQRTGYAYKPEEVTGSAIPCQYVVNNRSNIGKSQGEHFVKANYTIYIDAYYKATSERIILKDADGQELGEFAVLSAEPMRAVNQVKILV